MTTSETRPESQQLVVDGLVTEMLWTSNTFAHATGEHFAVSIAHRPRDAREPRPLMGEGELKQEALRKEIGELEAECELARNRYVEADPGSAKETTTWRTYQTLRETVTSKRRLLAALTDNLV